MSFEQLRFFAFLAGLTVWLAAESWRPRRAWRVSRLARWTFHLGVAAGNTLLVRLLVAGPLLVWADVVRDGGWGLTAALGLTGTVEVAVSLVVLDMLDYWWHRANHQVPFLWRLHEPHHADTHLDLTTSLRFHPTELLASGIVKASWIGIWGPSLAAFAIFEAAITSAAQFHHSNIDFPDRFDERLRQVLITPRVHASHHSARTRTLDANYGTIFPWWDWMFGTWIEPAPEHLGDVGLPYGRDRDLDVVEFLRSPLSPRRPRSPEPRSSRTAPGEAEIASRPEEDSRRA